MNFKEAFEYVDNAIEYYAELSDYDEKESDLKKTDKAWTMIRKTIEKNTKTIQLLRKERREEKK